MEIRLIVPVRNSVKLSHLWVKFQPRHFLNSPLRDFVFDFVDGACLDHFHGCTVGMPAVGGLVGYGRYQRRGHAGRNGVFVRVGGGT